MELVLKDKISDVERIELSSGSLFYCKNGGVYNQNHLLAEELDNCSFIVGNGFLYFNHKSGKKYLMNLTSNNVSKIKYQPFLHTLMEENKLYGRYDVKFEGRTLKWKIGLFDFKKNNLVKNIPELSNTQLKIMNKDIHIGIKFNQFVCAFKSSTEELIWEFDVSKFEREKKYNIKSVIGIWKEQVIVACNSSLIFTLNIKNGKIIRYWQRVPGLFHEGSSQLEYRDMLPPSRGFTLDKNRGILFSTHGHYYVEIDLSKEKVAYKNLRKELDINDISLFRSIRNPFNVTHIFSTVILKSEKFQVDWLINGIIALNRDTLEIDFLEVLREQNVGTHTPKFSGNELYQLDLDDTLFIYNCI